MLRVQPVLLVGLALLLSGCVTPDAAPNGTATGGPQATGTRDGSAPTPGPSDPTDPTPSPTTTGRPTNTASPSPTATQSASPSPTATTQPTTHTVEIGANTKGALADYDPDPVRIKIGDRIVWKNIDSAVHTATADDDSFDTGSIQGGKSAAAITFSTAGTFTYYCAAHPSTMKDARVIVEA